MTQGADMEIGVMYDISDCIDFHLDSSPFGDLGLTNGNGSGTSNGIQYNEECRAFTNDNGNYKLTIDGSVRKLDIEIDGDDSIEGSAEYGLRCIGEKDGECRAYELDASCEGYEGEVTCDDLTGHMESIVEDYNVSIRPNHQGNIAAGALIALI